MISAFKIVVGVFLGLIFCSLLSVAVTWLLVVR